MDEEQNKGVETAGKQAEEKKQNQGNKKNPAQKVDSGKKSSKSNIKIKEHCSTWTSNWYISYNSINNWTSCFFFHNARTISRKYKRNSKKSMDSFLNVFDGSSSVDRTITDEQMIDLAQRIDSMGYDISAYGFADVLEENENGAPTKIGANTDGKKLYQNIFNCK